jgi:hypothetical protein
MDLSSGITLIIIFIISICTLALSQTGDGISVVTLGLILIIICVFIKHGVDLKLIFRFLDEYDSMYTYDAMQEVIVLNQQKDLLNKITADALVIKTV